MKKTRPRSQKLRPKTNKDKPLSELTIELDLGSARIADAVYDSILPETAQPREFRAKTILTRKDRVLRLTIRSRDLVALRASSNTFLRFVAAAIKTLNVLTPFYSAEVAGSAEQ
ncbi:CTAG/PCC1 family protein [Candidatus Bathyarchaeota archaeon]|nr:CTAG/PCC1 family protein [Candidatus Bathyarchaeota archaeon]